MKPGVLTIEAFGPYAKKQVIDFDCLSGTDLVLIEGPTGAGKSTLFDAISFALYGVVPGARGKTPERLRSTLPSAEPLETRVSFSFSVRGETYRVERTPDQWRVKKRGNGETKDPQRAWLYLVEPNGKERLLCSQLRDVNLRIAETTGLKSHEFNQILVLPQGEFRQFLLSESLKKEELLRQLFGDSLHRRAVELIVEDAKQLTARLEKVDEHLSRRFARAGFATLEEIGAAAAGTRSALPWLVGELAERDAQAAAAQQRLGAAEAIHARFAQRARLEQERARLEAEAESIAAKRARLELAERAEPLRVGIAGLDRAVVLSQRALERAAKVELRFERANVRAAELAKDPDRLPRLREQVERGILDHAAAQRMLDSERSLRSSRSDLDAMRRSVAEAMRQVERRKKERDELAATLERFEEAIANGDRAREDQRLLLLDRAHYEGALRAKRARHELSLAEIALRLAVDAEREARAAEQSRIAERLRAELHAGDPCPVCGSLEHPRPASSVSAPVSALDAEAAAIARGRAEERFRRFQAEAAELEHVEVGNILETMTDLDQRESAVRQAVEAASKAAEQRLSARKRLATIERELAEIEPKATKDAAVLEQKDIEHATQETALREALGARDTDSATAFAERVDAELTARRTELAALEREHAEHASELAAATEARAASIAEREAAVAALEEANAVSRTLASEHGFAGHEEVRAALLDRAQRDALRAAADKHERALGEVERGIAELDEALELRVAPDLERIGAEARSSAHARDAAQAAMHDAQARLEELDALFDEVRTTCSERDALHAELTTLAPLADLLRGQNARGVSLSRYVLAATMQEVTVAATERLRAMSNGRYVLKLASDRVGRGAQGLDLVVEDRYAGETERPVHTLSGGEMFLASLSLAMGLADVVQSHAGGIQLDALFIDEGFGSLDDETLDHAMRTLLDLRKGGRLVGIISHLESLKERVPTRIEIRKAPSGSIVRMPGAQARLVF